MRLSSIASPGFSLSLPHRIVLIALLLLARRASLQAQTAASAVTAPPAAVVPAVVPPVVPPVVPSVTPIAIVSLGSGVPGSAASVTGALQVTGGRAMIAANGTVVSGATTTDVDLPHRGTLRVCASTAVKLAADASVPSGDAPGLMMAMDHGAIETDFATGRNADILLTPDFRILIGGPGTTNLKVRLGQDGDTCVDNPGPNAPYILVTSVFDGSLYRVQSGQRVMFEHGSLRDVVDQEKESCGCPPAPAEMKGNDFPLAQSEGLAPMPAPKPMPSPVAGRGSKPAPQTAPPLVYAAGAVVPAVPQASASASTAGATPAHSKKKPGFFSRLGHFFGRIFGAS